MYHEQVHLASSSLRSLLGYTPTPSINTKHETHTHTSSCLVCKHFPAVRPALRCEGNESPATRRRPQPDRQTCPTDRFLPASAACRTIQRDPVRQHRQAPATTPAGYRRTPQHRGATLMLWDNESKHSTEPTRYLLLFYGVPYLTGCFPGFWAPTPPPSPSFWLQLTFRES